MANVILGAGMLFGTSSTTGTITGLGSLTEVQSGEYNADSEEELIKDGAGNVATVVKFDHKAKATLEFIPTQGTANGGNQTIASWPSAGVTLALTDTAFVPFGVTWIVDSLQLTRSNTKAVMARLSLSRYLQNGVP